ncbi:MAG: cation-translocating P-type ATPase [Clostridia bacterium]|nr:cation-translocating P-type ATPase [Clostridia bacterium]
MQILKEYTEKENVFIRGTDEEEESRRVFGKNELTKKKRKSLLSIFVKNLGDPVIRILLFALALNIMFMLRGKDWHEGAGIALSVICATVISSISEYKRDSAYEKLNVSTAASCKVLREGGYVLLPTDRLTVGDIIELSAGERIPADCILIRGELKADQSPLTGESEDVEKRAGPALCARLTSLLTRFFAHEEVKDALDAFAREITPDCPYALFGGCHVSFGSAVAMVYSVGDNTRLGMISGSLFDEDEKSPLREKLDALAKQISRIGYAASALIALAYLFNVFVIESSFSKALLLAKLADTRFVITALLGAFTVALTVIVMAVPEGLPMMIAVVLSRNARKMARDNVLVRHAPGIEAAGCMNILFTDKTGTLTEGKPSVCAVITGEKEYRTRGSLSSDAPILEEMLALCAVFNTSASFGADGSIIGGNTAERVLLSFSSFPTRKLNARRTEYSPFDSIKKSSSAKITYRSKEYGLFKGAPEILLPRAELIMTPGGETVKIDRRAFEEKIKAHTSCGERVLLCAFSEGDSPMCIICAVAMRDPLRKEAREAVSDLKGAGVHVVMITGDGKQTAEKIASDCRILTPLTPVSLSGDDLNHLSDGELSDILDRLAVIHRALPEHKARLVKIAKSRSCVCGMTGDGLNDAPALKNADCGFALGCGSEVSKDAADIIILDDNLASVVNAVMHGRNIFASIRKFITLQLIINFTAMAISMIGPFIGIESPITVVQMLWINIVMDTLGGLAFAGEHAHRRLLREKPKKRSEPVLNRPTVSKIARLSLFTCALCIFFLKSPAVLSLFGCAEGTLYHLTAFFALFIFAGALNCFNARSDRLNMLSGISKNPTFIAIIALVAIIQTVFIYFGSTVMRTVPLALPHLALTVIFALPVVVFEFLSKLYLKLTVKDE